MIRDRRQTTRRRPALAIALALAVASGCAPLTPVQPGGKPASTPPLSRTAASAAPMLPNLGTLTGTVLGPTAAIVSNNGGSLISQTKDYHLADEAQYTQAIAGAQVVALDTNGKTLSSSVTTDSKGRYTLTGIGPSGPVIFVRANFTVAGHALVLSRVVAAPRQGSASAQLDPASTLVAKKLTALLTLGAFPADAINPDAAAQLADALAPTIEPPTIVAAAAEDPSQASQTFNQLVEDNPDTTPLISSVASGVDLLASPAPMAPPSGTPSSATPSTAASGATTSAAPTASPAPGTSAGPSPSPGPTVTPGSSPTPSPSLAPPYLTTLAGSGATALVNANGSAAGFDHPSAIVADASGNTYVGDVFNHAIRKIDAHGNVTTLVSQSGFTPWGLAIGPYGVLFVADTNNDVIRTVTPNGQMSVYAGAVGVAGSIGGSLTNARFNLPEGIAFDSSNNLYVSTVGDNRIRKIDTSSNVTTFAGSSKGLVDGTGTAAQFDAPRALCFDPNGNLIVADRFNHCIRRITPAGAVTTIAGNGTAGNTDGPALQASFDEPQGVLYDSYGDLLIADSQNNCIRVLNASGQVSTMIGSSAGYADGGVGVGLLDNPLGLALGAYGVVEVGDAGNNRVRLLVPSAP